MLFPQSLRVLTREMPTLVPEAQFRAVYEVGWQHRSRNRNSSRRASDDERTDLQTLHADRYWGWNVRHSCERYREARDGERSYTWVKNVLQDTGLLERRWLGPMHQGLIS